MKQKRLNWAALLFWAALLAVIGLMVIEMKPNTGGWVYRDKVQHIGVFAMLSGLGFLAYRSKIWVVLGLAALGGLLEILQGIFTATRKPSLFDWYADLAGIAVGFVLFYVIRAIWMGKNRDD